MKNQCHKISLCGFLATIFFSLIACGDDITELEVVQQPSMFSAVADSLPVCDTVTTGQLYVISEKMLLCNGKKWTELNGVSAENGSEGTFCKTAAIKDGLKVVCDGDSVGVIKNGAAGESGKDGASGKNGSYCIAESIPTGYAIVCDGKMSGIISDGIPGSSGSKGDDGADGTYCITSATSSGFDVICNNNKIGEITNGTPGSSGSKGADGFDGTYCITSATSTGYDVICDSKKVGEIHNGNPGTSGLKGNPGEKGKFCVTTATSTGFNLVCDGNIVGEIRNGEPGSAGSVGGPAVGCSIEKNDDGSYTQKCGKEESVLYAAICGSESYDPQGNQFCYGVKLYDKCKGSVYTPSTESCTADGVRPKCGMTTYNPETQFCQNGTPTVLCGGDAYTADQFCDGNTVVDKCDGSIYAPSTESCTADGVRPNCGTTTYNPETQFCQNGTPTALCGGNTYTADQFCDGSNVVDKCMGNVYDPALESCTEAGVRTNCGTKTYDPATHFCRNNSVVSLCGGQTYTTSQFCQGTVVKELCGGRAYATNEYCIGTTVYADCNGKPYIPSQQICRDGSVLGKCGSATFDINAYFCDTRDNHIYKYVVIGTQTWMAENLNYVGSRMPSSSYCYNGDEKNCDKYGRLYVWATTLTNVCPAGWHLPSNAEYGTLVNYVGGSNAGDKIKSTSGWVNRHNGVDTYGFNALPGGWVKKGDTYESYYGLTSLASFWSATSANGYDSYSVILDNTTNFIDTRPTYKYYGYSIRCVKN